MKTYSSPRNPKPHDARRKLFLAALVAIAAMAGLAVAGSNRSDAFVAHEWGTFTSVQASDGVLLNWQVVAPAELPAFVYSWARPELSRRAIPSLGKGVMALQRMETPVIYFYGDKAQKIDVTVRFPKGRITEWYPQARDLGPTLPRAAALSLKTLLPAYGATEVTNRIQESLIRWNIEMVPPGQAAQMTLPKEASGNHYYAARETDAAVLRVNPTQTGQLSTEYEKFLFYRGVGNFGTPLKATMSASGEITLGNTGPEALKDLFIFEVNSGTGNFLHVREIPAGGQKTFVLGSERIALPKLMPQISHALATALTGHGLYQRESEAMVKTWNDSWFQEEGLRVLYVLPRAWTDQTLPITLKPSPRNLVRVMVGRSELITPGLENKLAGHLARAKAGDVSGWSDARILLKTCGRFASPVFYRVLAKIDPKNEDKVLAALLSETTRPN